MEKKETVRVSKAALNRIIRQQSELKKQIEMIINRQVDMGTVLYLLYKKQVLCDTEEEAEKYTLNVVKEEATEKEG